MWFSYLGPSIIISLLFSRPSCARFCDSVDCSTPGLPVPHHLQEFAQVHVHCISDAIQPSHPLMPSSPPALNLFPASGTFPMSHLFGSDDKNTGASASASVHIIAQVAHILLKNLGG